jgi:hypothetical protein
MTQGQYHPVYNLRRDHMSPEAIQHAPLAVRQEAWRTAAAPSNASRLETVIVIMMMVVMAIGVLHIADVIAWWDRDINFQLLMGLIALSIVPRAIHEARVQKLREATHQLLGKAPKAARYRALRNACAIGFFGFLVIMVILFGWIDRHSPATMVDPGFMQWVLLAWITILPGAGLFFQWKSTNTQEPLPPDRPPEA